MTDDPNLRTVLWGVQLTLLALVALALPGAVSGVESELFAGIGVLLAVVGTAVVAVGLLQ
jgi:hypothetical protein